MTRDIAHALLLRARSEYLEMPGLRLSAWQAAKLFGVEPAASEHVLMRLVETGFLLRNEDGLFVRSSGR